VRKSKLLSMPLSLEDAMPKGKVPKEVVETSPEIVAVAPEPAA